MEGRQGQVFWQKSIVVCIVAIFCCVLWGSAFPSIKLGYQWWHIGDSDTGSQILFAGLRFAIAGILTLFFGSIIYREPMYPKREAAKPILVLALCQTVIQYFFFYVGLAGTSGTNASIITATNVFLSILIASLIFGQEKLDKYKILGCVLGFSGVFLVNIRSVGGLTINITGDGAILLSALSSAVSAVFIKKYSEKHHPVMLSGSQFLFGGLLLMVLGMFLGGSVHIESVRAFLILLYLAALSATAYTLWGILLKYNPVSKVAIYGFSNPVAGVFLSMLLLGEKQQGGMVVYISLLLVSMGIFVVNWFAEEEE